MTLPAGSISQPSATSTDQGTTVETATAWITTYKDGSTSIKYKNEPIVDSECKSYSTQDINNGLVCQYNIGVAGKADYFELRYIPTERWTGKVQSWGEFKANLDKAVALNPKYAESARHNIYYNNPSWAFVIGGSRTPDGKYKTPDGSALSYAIEQGNYSILGYPDSFVPEYIGPTTTSGGATVAVKDPATGTWIDTTTVKDPNAPITPDGRSLTDIVNPGNGAPAIPPPLGAPKVSGTVPPTPGNLPLSGPGGYMKPNVDPLAVVAPTPAPAPAPSGNSSWLPIAILIAVATGIFLL